MSTTITNKTRALEFMGRYAIDAIVATTPINVQYFTGYAGWVHRVYKEYHTVPGQSSVYRQAYGLLSALDSNDIGLIVPINISNYAAQNTLYAKDIVTYGRYDTPIESILNRPEEKKFKYFIDAVDRNALGPGQALVQMLQERGLEKGVIALDSENISPTARALLEKKLPNAQIKAGDEVLRFIRMVKTEHEMQLLKHAAEVNERAYQVLVENATPGITEVEMQQLVRETIAKGGGEFKFCNCPFGSRAGGFFPPNDNRLELGDMIWFDFGCSVDSYNADTGGTIVLGSPSDRLRKIYSTMEAAERTAIDETKPGMKPSQIAKTIDDIVMKAGFSPPRSLGHGIGLEEREYPLILRSVNPTGVQDGFIKESTDIPLEEGMVMNQEVPYRILGWGGTQIEFTIIVSESGGKPLLTQSRILHIR